LGVERDVADLVTDEQWVALETAQLVLETALALCVGEQSDPLGGGAEQDTLPGEACADRERDREMCLAGAGWPEKDHVFLGVQEVELPEMLDHLLFDGALEGEVELLERLRAGNLAALIRSSPPEASREAISVDSSASVNRS
jgi:hypothetical protein